MEEKLLKSDSTYTPNEKIDVPGFRKGLLVKDVYKRVRKARMEDIEKELKRRAVYVFEDKDIRDMTDKELLMALVELKNEETLIDERIAQQNAYWKP